MAASANSNGDAAPVGRDFLTLREAVKLTNCHENTIRRASDSGELKAYRLPSGHRRWNRSDIFSWLGIEDFKPAEQAAAKVLIYARVSSHKQSKNYEKGSIDNDLGRQIERLKKVGLEKYQSDEPIIYQDTGSGLSFSRKGLNRLLNEILNGKYNNSILLCSFRDRLARFGTELVLTICKHHNLEVVFTEKEMDESQEKELADDVLAVVTHFSARVHGARASKTTTKILAAETIALIKQLYDSGQSIPQIVSYLKAEKLRSEDGAVISYHCISKYLNNKLLLEILPKQGKTNLENYAEQRLIAAEPNCRIATTDIYADYVQWCKNHNQPAATINKLSQLLGRLGYSRSYAVGEKRIKGYAGVKIKDGNKHHYIQQIRRGSLLEQQMKTAK